MIDSLHQTPTEEPSGVDEEELLHQIIAWVNKFPVYPILEEIKAVLPFAKNRSLRAFCVEIGQQELLFGIPKIPTCMVADT